MSTQDQDNDITLASYETAVDRYLEHSAPPGPEMVRYLDRFSDLVGSGRVLELGSGPGWDALHLEARGVQVTRSDATPAFLTRLHAAGYDALHLDMRTDDLGGPWDGLLADAVLLHLSRPQLAQLLARARSAVSDGGVLGVTLKEGDGSAWTTDKLEHPRHFTYWREPALREVLTQTGWTVHHLHHVAGRHEPWLYVCALASRQERTKRPEMRPVERTSPGPEADRLLTPTSSDEFRAWAGSTWYANDDESAECLGSGG